jgi:hypothetical protein
MRNGTLQIRTTTAAPMPTWPPVAGRRTITLKMPEHQIQHLDAQAAYEGTRRAAYFRRLVVTDRDRNPSHAELITVPTTESLPVTFELSDTLIDHLDTQAARLDCSRAAFIRHLIARDIRRNGPAR